jgi:tetratricopeptide (TPR) repeat protein
MKDSPPKTVIVGLGGIGKTQIVLELAYRTKERYPGCSVLWLPATDVETLQQAFTNIGRGLKVPGIEKDQADATKLVQHYLTQQSAGQWLLIVDNIDDMDIWKTELRNHLPRSQTGCIVFTTRTRKVAVEISLSNVIEVQKMDAKMATELLIKLVPKQELLEDHRNAQNLLVQLAYIPLAIVQAAAYIKKNGTALSKYLALLDSQEQQAIELLSEDFDDDSRYKDTANVKNSVATTWLISFEQIRRDDPLAADYLSFISCVAAKNIPESLLPPELSLVKQESAIGTLDAYSFVTRRATDRVLDVHRLVQLATRNWLRGKNEWRLWTENTLARLVEVVPVGGHERKEVWVAYLPHAIHVAGLTDIGDDEGLMSLLHRIGRCEQALGRYEASEWAHMQLLERKIQLFGKENPSTLSSVNDVGLSLTKQGRYKEAEEMLRRALEGNEKLLGLKHLETLINIDNLGFVLLSQGRYKEAEEMHRRALEGKEKVVGPDHVTTLMSVDNLGSALLRQGRYKEAEEMHRQALERKEKALGLEHSETLISLGNLGSVLSRQGRYKEAEEMTRRALEGNKKVLGLDHSETLISLSNLGSVLSKQGIYKEAEEIYRRALEGFEKVLGPEHSETVISLGNLGSVLLRQGRYKEAEEMIRRALEGNKKVLGPDHSETLTSVSNLGSALFGQGRYEEAGEMYCQALEGREKEYGPDHPATLASVCNLAFNFHQQRQYEASLPLYERASDGYERVLGLEHPTTVECSAHYSSLLQEMKDM